jgi:diguanylate cyclase (GGDEF)-like protein
MQPAIPLICAYSSNDANLAGLRQAAEAKGYRFESLKGLDPAALEASYAESAVLVFDLTCAAISAEKVVAAVDTLDPDRLPPVLYLLASPADIEVVAGAGSIYNQDYAFVPLATESLASRLEVLVTLGLRRRMALESAITDRLSGLYNRKYFLRRLEEELYRCARYGYVLGVVLADVDFQAKDGSQLSEESGTHVIREIGEFFRGRLRRSDIVARFKWSEFALLLPELSREDLHAVAEDIRRKVEALEIRANDHPLQLRLAIGELCFPTEGVNTAIDVVAALEDCVIQARQNGGIRIYLPNS